MLFFRVSANLMSLGAIDFGIVVDGANHYYGTHYCCARRGLYGKEIIYRRISRSGDQKQFGNGQVCGLRSDDYSSSFYPNYHLGRYRREDVPPNGPNGKLCLIGGIAAFKQVLTLVAGKSQSLNCDSLPLNPTLDAVTAAHAHFYYGGRPLWVECLDIHKHGERVYS